MIALGRKAPRFKKIAVALLAGEFLFVVLEIVASDAERLAQMIEHKLCKLLPLLDGASALYYNSHSFESAGIERYVELK